MSNMVSELYEALIDAGASSEKAKAAAEALFPQQTATKEDMEKLRKDDLENLRNDIKRLHYLVTGLYIAGAATLGYIVNLLNTIIGKL